MTAAETTFTAQLVTGFAELLATDPAFTWNVDGAYDPADTGIGVMNFPLMCPRAVAIGPYPLSANATLSQSMIGIQFKSRGTKDPFDVWLMDDAIQRAFLGRFPMVLPTGIRIASLVWSSGSSLGQQADDIWLWVSNFAANVNRPGPYRQ